MTDKIYPTWVNNRLPTEEDTKYSQVIVWIGVSENGKRKQGFDYKDYCDVNDGETWCNERKNGKLINWDDLASPQECLDRAKGDDVEEYTGEDDERTLAEKRADGAIATMEFRVKNLKEKLAKSEERVKYLNDENDTLWRLLKIYKFGGKMNE